MPSLVFGVVYDLVVNFESVKWSMNNHIDGLLLTSAATAVDLV